MPQMKPINWIIYFFMFSMIFYILLSINYFNNYKLNTNPYSITPINNNSLKYNFWKW